MRAIIIATGQSKRLMPLTESKPVSFLKIDQVPLIEHQLKALNEAGINEVVVIAGKFFEKFKRLNKPNLKLKKNPFYPYGNILSSMWLLKKYLAQPFILIYDDVYFDHSILELLKKPMTSDVVLATSKADIAPEAEKTHIENNRITKIGKTNFNGDFHAEYIGLAHFKETSLKYLVDYIETLVENNLKSRFTDLIQKFISEGFHVEPVDVKDSLWADIDTPDDLHALENKLGKKDYTSIALITMCADPLHYGHINIIKQAKKYGDKVIVGLLTDKAIKEYKSPPLMPYEYRRIVVESIKDVDEVIPQDSGLDYSKTLHSLRPNYLVHGDDWIYGRLSETRKKAIETMKLWSGKVIDIQYTEGICSTDIKKKLKAGK